MIRLIHVSAIFINRAIAAMAAAGLFYALILDHETPIGENLAILLPIMVACAVFDYLLTRKKKPAG